MSWCCLTWQITRMVSRFIVRAAPAAIAATQRLYDKGLVTQKDGGYLTPLGLEAAEHAQTLLTVLTSKPGE